MRYYDVFALDPLQDLPGLGYVIPHAKTGVVWLNQYGGYKCLHGKVEGHLLPADLSTARPLLDELFLRDLAMSGTPVGGLSAANRDDLAAAVDKVEVGKAMSAPFEPLHLDFDRPRLDLARIAEADEAWVPVLLANEPATLVWFNSD